MTGLCVWCATHPATDTGFCSQACYHAWADLQDDCATFETERPTFADMGVE